MLRLNGITHKAQCTFNFKDAEELRTIITRLREELEWLAEVDAGVLSEGMVARYNEAVVVFGFSPDKAFLLTPRPVSDFALEVAVPTCIGWMEKR